MSSNNYLSCYGSSCGYPGVYCGSSYYSNKSYDPWSSSCISVCTSPCHNVCQPCISTYSATCAPCTSVCPPVCPPICPQPCPNITYITNTSALIANTVVNGTTPLQPFPTGSTSIPATSSAIVNFLTVPLVSSGGITLNATNGQFTVPVSGRYLISATIGFTTNATGSRELDIYKYNTTTGIYTLLASDSRLANADSPTYITVTTAAELSANEIIVFVASQNSGAPLNLTTDGRVAITRIG